MLLFPRFADAIRELDLDGVRTAHDIPAAFLLAREGRFSSHYLPFEHVNPQARVVVVGITPGLRQWKNAMAETQRQLALGAPTDDLLRAVRQAGAFSGAIRPNLIALLDAIGLPRWLGLETCAGMFGADAHLFHITGLLRHAVFVDGVNYGGAPDPVRTPFLRTQIADYFAHEASLLPGAVYVPVGAAAASGLAWLAEQGAIPADRILHGLPHPSGANSERVAYFLGRKDRATLSAQTNAGQLDAARTDLLARVARLR
jgi:hypothetical protein